MSLGDRIKGALNGFCRPGELERLAGENRLLREKERTEVSYIRRKVNQLLMVMGTLPLRPEELDDRTLLELDPIGIIADSFTQILDHLNATNESLRLAHGEIQAILSAAGVGILVVDKEMRIQAYNQKLRDLFLRNGSTIIGSPCYQLLCNRQCPPEECTFEKVMASRVSVRVADWVNDERHFEVAGAPIKNRYGDITHVVLVYTDITDHRRTEMVLRESSERYRTVFDNASDMIQSVNPDGSFNFVNRAWRETLGYREDEIAGLSFLDVIHPEHREGCQSRFRDLLAGKKFGPLTTVFLAKNGSPVVVEGNLSIGFIDGRPTATSCIFRRVSPRTPTPEI